MKILIATDSYKYQVNGVTSSILFLVDELIKNGHDVKVLSMSYRDKSYIDGNEYYIKSKSVSIYPDARFSFVRNDQVIDSLIKWKPDIVHIQTEFSAKDIALKIIKKVGCPYVMTCHTDYEEYVSKRIGKLISKPAATIFNRLNYNKANALIVPSVKIKLLMNKYKVKSKIVIIPTGIDLVNYQKEISKSERNELLKKYHLNHAKVLVSVSRVSKEKNIEELIYYMKDLKKKDKNIKLLVVGGGPYLDKLKDLVSRLALDNDVYFTGMVKSEDIYKYYALGDIFVSASTFETQGLTYVEALCAHLPLVCRKDKCLDSIIDEDLNGYTYFTKDEYITSILKIINNKKTLKDMGNYSYEKSFAFDKKEYGKKIINLYEKVIKEYEK